MIYFKYYNNEKRVANVSCMMKGHLAFNTRTTRRNVIDFLNVHGPRNVFRRFPTLFRRTVTTTLSTITTATTHLQASQPVDGKQRGDYPWRFNK